MMVACSIDMTARLATPDFSGSDGCMPSPTPHIVDQLKNELRNAADNNDESSGISILNKLEKLNLTKENLESTRIGGIVNEIRKRVAEPMPKFSNACRALIKQWRKTSETYTRSASSCGGSNGVTPSMMSPAIRRLVTPSGATPHTPIRLQDGSISKSQISSPRVPPNPLAHVSGVRGSSNDLVAQAIEKVQLHNGNDHGKPPLKRKIEASISPPEAQSAIKRCKSALVQPSIPTQLSLSAVRQNAQSTTELVAQLSENLPSHLAPDLTSAPKSRSISPRQQPTFHLQPIQKEKRKYTKRASRFFKDEPSVSELHETVIPKVEKKAPLAPTVKPKDKKVDWFASIPSIEELRQKMETTNRAPPSTDNRKSYIVKVDNHELICLPFVDIGIPDVIEFNYPADKNPKIEVPYPRMLQSVMKNFEF